MLCGFCHWHKTGKFGVITEESDTEFCDSCSIRMNGYQKSIPITKTRTTTITLEEIKKMVEDRSRRERLALDKEAAFYLENGFNY